MAQAYLISSELIKSVKRRASIPGSQNLFTTEDFLAFANEEVQIGIVPSVLKLHEDYFTYSEAVALVPDQTNYPVPYRAIGQTIRDLFYMDTSGNLQEMTRLQGDDRAAYQEGAINNFIGYYFEGNNIVITPPVGSQATGSILVVYYFRPNSIVEESRTAQIESIDITERTITSIGTGVSTVQISFAGSHDLIENDYIRLAGTNSTPSIDGLYQVASVVNSTNITIAATVTVTGDEGTATPGKIVCTDSIPDNLTVDSLVDFIEQKAGNRTKGFDKTIKLVSSGAGEIQFDPEDLPSTLIVGDYICTQQETPIPQIPTDLHSILAQRIACRCLESMGDTQGLENANKKLAEMELSLDNIISSRSDGTPKKINSRRTPIRYSAIAFRRGSRY